MSKNYKFLNPEGLYFVIFTLVVNAWQLKAESWKPKADSQ